MRIFVDITKAWMNSTTQMLTAASVYLSANATPTSQLTIFCRPDQRAEVASMLVGATIVEADQISAIGAVSSAVQNAPATDRCVVFSFNPVVLLAASKIVGRNVETRKMVELLAPVRSSVAESQGVARAYSTGQPSRPPESNVPAEGTRFSDWRWASAANLTKDEALALLKQTLEEHAPHFGGRMQMTDIKPLMAYRAPQLRGKGSLTGLSGFMSDLIAEAEAAGVVKSEHDPVRPMVRWISLAKGAPSAGGSVSASVSMVETRSVPETPSRPPAMSIPSRPEPLRTQDASQEMERLLRNANFGPYSDARSLVFDAIDEILAPNGFAPLPLVVLVERGADLARNKLEELNEEKILHGRLAAGTDGPAADRAKALANKQPWREIRTFVRELILRTAVAIDEDSNRIVGSPSAALKKVKELQKGWRETVDAEIAIACIRLWCDAYRVGGLADRYVDALSGMLHHKTYGGVVERTLQILDLLVAAGRLGYDSGSFRIAPPGRS